MDESVLQNHPDLQPFVLSNVRATGVVIGSGAYGSVEEVEFSGTMCAAKKIHDTLVDFGTQKMLTSFVNECRLMSSLRHPNIVQFLGITFLEGSRLPVIVMELLMTSLHDLLDPYPQPDTPPIVPLGLKHSILLDVAKGLSSLHEHSPPIIHRDLSARNVLLSSSLVAKIADLGTARLANPSRVSAMTGVPGAMVYMPPEAMEVTPYEKDYRYSISIDIFSLGVVAIFALSNTFPCYFLPTTYLDKNGLLNVRTELERREKYMNIIYKQLGEDHPLVSLIKDCLQNVPEKRPNVQQVLQYLEDAKRAIPNEDQDLSKLELLQAMRDMTLRMQDETRSRKEQTLGESDKPGITVRYQEESVASRQLLSDEQFQQQKDLSSRDTLEEKFQQLKDSSQRNITALEKRLQDLEDSSEQRILELNHYVEKLKREKEFDELQNHILENQIRHLEEANKAQILFLKEQLSQMMENSKIQATLFQEQIQQLKESNKQLKECNKQLESQLKQLEESSNRRISALERQLDQLDKQLKDKDSLVAELKETLQEKDNELEKLKAATFHTQRFLSYESSTCINTDGPTEYEPDPGEMKYSRSQSLYAAQPLSDDDFDKIASSLQPLSVTEIYHLGFVLGISHQRLVDIRQSDIFLHQMIDFWLKKVDKVIIRGWPSWQTLIHALKHPSIKQVGLAQDIADKYITH